MSQSEFDTAARRLAAIIESSDDAIVSKDLDGTIRSWNQAAERLFGYAAAEVIGRSIRLIIPAERESEEDETLQRIRRGETVDHFETIRQRKDGSRVPVSLTVSPVRNASGEIIGASKIARDISDRKRAEAALTDIQAAHANLQHRLLSLVAASRSVLVSPRVEDVLPAILTLAQQIVAADAYAVWRVDGASGALQIKLAAGTSDEFTATMKSVYQAEGLTRYPFAERPYVAEDLQSAPISADRRGVYQQEGIASMLAVPLSIEGDETGMVTFYYKDSHRFTEVETQIATALGNLASAAITAAELYDAQRRSRRQSEFLAEAGTILAASLDYHETLKRVANLAVPHFADWCAVDLVDDGGAIRRLAAAHVDPVKVDLAQQLYGRYPEDPASPYSVAHVVSTRTPMLVEHLSDDVLAAAARDKEHLRAMRELQIHSFMIVPLSAGARTLGAITLVAAESRRRYHLSDLQFAQDLASRAALAVDNARAYEETRRANQVKDDFLVTLSHELRTPLNAILGYARMLKTGMLAGDRRARAIEILEKNATSLTQIVEDMLDMSRIVAGKMRLNVQRVDLPGVLTQSAYTVQPAADAKGVRVQMLIDPRAAPVAGDADRLQQVIWNLLANAVKFTPRGGRIEVRLERVDSHVEIVISDTGIGIAPEFLPHIFERFRQADSRFSREHGGLGLGLAIARNLVEMHGGSISASSEGIGRGTTFRIKLPTMIVNAEPLGTRERGHPLADTAVDPVRTRLDGSHVLAVDDDEDALTLLREILEGAGAQVTTAESAPAALLSLEKTAPDLLLSDIGMPGMDGFELLSRVRRAAPSSSAAIPAIALTAHARSEDRTRALRAGFQMHLAKPIDPGELVAAIGAVIHRQFRDSSA